MEYDKKTDQFIVDGDLKHNGKTVGKYTIYKDTYNLNKPFINIDIDINTAYNIPDNVGNNLNCSLSEYKMTQSLTILNNDLDLELFKMTEEEIATKLNKDLYTFLKAVVNYSYINKNIIEQVNYILNMTLEPEELGIYNDFDKYYFDEETLNNCLVWCLKSCPIFIGLTEEEIIKTIVQYYIKTWLSGRYEINISY